jgi:glycosyltransferase involved in cell wall biosynthesis
VVSFDAFSLLMPVYFGDRADHFLRAFLSTVTEQTVKPAEVVIVEDGPLSPEMHATLGRLAHESPVPIVRVSLEANVGLALALEAGLAQCSNEIVARMDADDISEPTRFEKQMALMAKGYDLVGAGLIEFEGHESVTGITRTPPTGDDIASSARLAQPFYHPTVVFKKSVIAAVGGYRDIGPMEDYWLFARVIHSGANVANIAEPLVRYRISDGAYARRGGWGKLITEINLQRQLRRLGFTSRAQFLRNLIVRGGYRLVPEGVRRTAYRRLIANRFEAPTASKD